MKKIKIAFFGTGNFSANILKSLISDFSDDLDIKLAVSQPDKPVWRKKILENTPVKIVAEENNIKLLQPEKLKNNSDFFEQLEWFDFIVVVAYGKIVPNEVLNAPKYACINIHGSILPDYRWASPIQESIKNWDKKTGLTIMYMSEGMDEGDILKIEEVEIWDNDKTPDIFNKFEKIWPDLLVKTLRWVLNWGIKWKKQDNSKATYCSKISKQDWEINFTQETWDEIYNKFRAYYPWPWIYSYFNEQKINFENIELVPVPKREDIVVVPVPCKVIKLDKKNIWVVCKNNKIVLLKQVKLEWKKSMDILSFVNWNKEFLDYKFN